MSEEASFDAVIKALRMLKRIRRLEGTFLIHEGVLLSADTLYHDSQNEAFVREVNALISLYRNSNNPISRALLGFDGGNVMLFHAAPYTMGLLFGDISNAEVVEKAGEDFLHQWADSLKLDTDALERLPDLRSEMLVEPEESGQATSEEKVSEGAETLPIVPVAVAQDDDVAPGEVTPESKPALDDEEPEPTVPDGPDMVGSLPAEEISEDQSMEESPERRWSAYRDKVETLFSKVLGRAQATRLIQRELTAMGVEDGGHLATNQFRPFGQKLIKKVKDRTLRKQLELELIAIVETFVN